MEDFMEEIKQYMADNGLENDKMLKDHESSIKELQKSIEKFNKVTKWAVVTFGGGFVSILIKLIHDYILNHVHIT